MAAIARRGAGPGRPAPRGVSTVLVLSCRPGPRRCFGHRSGAGIRNHSTRARKTSSPFQAATFPYDVMVPGAEDVFIEGPRQQGSTVQVLGPLGNTKIPLCLKHAIAPVAGGEFYPMGARLLRRFQRGYAPFI